MMYDNGNHQFDSWSISQIKNRLKELADETHQLQQEILRREAFCHQAKSSVLKNDEGRKSRSLDTEIYRQTGQ